MVAGKKGRFLDDARNLLFTYGVKYNGEPVLKRKTVGSGFGVRLGGYDFSQRVRDAPRTLKR